MSRQQANEQQGNPNKKILLGIIENDATDQEIQEIYELMKQKVLQIQQNNEPQGKPKQVRLLGMIPGNSTPEQVQEYSQAIFQKLQQTKDSPKSK